MTRAFYLFISLCSLILLSGCDQQPPPTNERSIVILLDTQSPVPLSLAGQDLQKDLQQVTDAAVAVVEASRTLPPADLYYVIATIADAHTFDVIDTQLVSRLEAENPGARGGFITKSTYNGKPVVVLAGEDIQGTQYSVYDYSKLVLGIDPLSYWTGTEAAARPFDALLAFDDTRIAPPEVPYLVYFENDVDELANLRTPSLTYDWESFTQMIDSLVRLRYNGIEIFDMLGRAEYYIRPEYQQMVPGYQLDQEHLNRMLDYIHAKGMAIQVDMMMGRQLRTLSEEASNCWSEHKSEWLDTWRYYLEETPLGKADTYGLRPRHQVWDTQYVSHCGENKVEVFNEVFAELDRLLDEYRPDATRLAVLYDDGMEMFNEGLRPPEDYILAWSDNGWGEFDYLPDSTEGYRFGTYMHAGFWLNHDVVDPYPGLVEQTMGMMYDKHDATDYLMVNGQTFRPFMLNLEAFSESARLGSAFDSTAFYRQWLSRYFGDAAVDGAREALEGLHQANADKVGYVEILWQIKSMHGYLAEEPVRRPGRGTFIAEYDKIAPWLDDTRPRVAVLEQALKSASDNMASVQKNQDFYHDHIVLPINLYLDLLNYNQALIDLVRIKTAPDRTAPEGRKQEAMEKLAEARRLLDVIYQRRATGDRDAKWGSWYAPEKRRPNNGFPRSGDLDAIERAIQASW